MEFSRLEELLHHRNFSELKEELSTMQEADIAEFMNELDQKLAILVFRLLPKDIAANVFSHLSSTKQSEISMQIDEKELSDIIEELFFDDMIDYIEEMPANVVKKIIRNTSEAERSLINQFLRYPENSAGSIMTIEFVDLKKYMLVKDALQRIRETAQSKETIYTCYVIDGERKLEGIVSLRDLVLADPDKKIEDIMETDIIYVTTYDDQESIADTFRKYGFLAMPVVDQEQRLVGIITVDDIVDVIEEENTEDFHKMAAIQPLSESYLQSSPLDLAKKRIGWLLILMLSAAISGAIISRYEDALQSVVSLTVFIPMLMNTGGNAGSQSATLVIRSLALGETSPKDVFKVIWKELGVSILVAIPLAIVNFLRIYYLQGYSMLLSATVSFTLVVTVIFAKLIGGTLPLLADRMHIDPAIMASPLITTIVDAITLMCYFRFAVWLLGV